MGQLQSNDEIYSVLYVDFDNMYNRLLEQDAGLAKIFATSPHKWMRWIDAHAIRMMYGDGIRRRILKRICYMNSSRYAEFKPFFVRSAFVVNNCLPSINQDKTNVDILLTMQCLDDLKHTTRYDEFIILSADADFTPLIFRINEYARRSIVLSVGHISPAYASACSWRIREDWFITQALEEAREDEDGQERYDSASKGHERIEPRGRRHTDLTSREIPSTPNKLGATNISVYQRMKLVEAIKQLAAESAAPVPLPSIAQVIQADLEGASDWFGAGTLRELIESLDIAPLKFSPIGQGFIYSPDKHKKPELYDVKGDFRQTNPELFNFAYSVHSFAAVPLLKPEHYVNLIDIIVSEINSDGYLDDTIKNIQEICQEDSLPISIQHIEFIVNAIKEGGVDVQKCSRPITSESLHAALLKRITTLCKSANIKFGSVEQKWLQAWLGGNK